MSHPLVISCPYPSHSLASSISSKAWVHCPRSSPSLQPQWLPHSHRSVVSLQNGSRTSFPNNTSKLRCGTDEFGSTDCHLLSIVTPVVPCQLLLKALATGQHSCPDSHCLQKTDGPGTLTPHHLGTVSSAWNACLLCAHCELGFLFLYPPAAHGQQEAAAPSFVIFALAAPGSLRPSPFIGKPSSTGSPAGLLPPQACLHCRDPTTPDPNPS